MIILAFDTTSEQGGAAIYRDCECLGSVANQGGANYSVTLFAMVEHLLAETRRKLQDVDLIAVANGPGSFTGIRVGVAAAQGWAKVLGRPVRAVSVLAAMVGGALPPTNWAAPIIDARRGEFFLGLFRRPANDDSSLGSGFTAEHLGCVLKPAALGPFLKERIPLGDDVTCLVREHDQLAQELKPMLPSSFQWQTVRGLLISAVAQQALVAHHQGKIQSPDELDAYYIRRSDAELNRKG